MKLTSTSPPASRCAVSKASAGISKAPRHEAQQGPEQTQHQRRAKEIRHAEDAHLGDRRLEKRQQNAAAEELCAIARKADAEGSGRRAERRQPPRDKNAGDQRDVKQKLYRSRELEHGEMPAGIFEHHRLMHHGELQMRR